MVDVEVKRNGIALRGNQDRKSTRLNSSHGYISYAVFCLKKKKTPWRMRAHWAMTTRPIQDHASLSLSFVPAITVTHIEPFTSRGASATILMEVLDQLSAFVHAATGWSRLPRDRHAAQPPDGWL